MNTPIEHSPQTFGNGRSVLISGASIAGPALAYWLHEFGFSVTMVEQSQTIRLGGYPIDLRGSAMQVAERMGLLAELFQEHIRSEKATFLDEDGREIATVEPEWIHGAVRGRDVELPRGTLTSLLVSLTRDRIPYQFGTSIAAISDRADGVEVTFTDGGREMFDIVVGADGVHSNTRQLAFGPDADFAWPIGYCFAGFSTPNMLGLSHEAICVNAPGRLTALYAVGEKPKSVFTLLAFSHPYLLGREGREPAFQRDLTAKAFAGAGWKLPELIASMQVADDLYFDAVQQIRMPAWTKGRIALVGDAAYAPSFLTGQGSSLALVGAYVLACELALHADHRDAFAAYNSKLRPFVEMNQATVDQGKVGMIPSTPEQLEQRKASLLALVGASAMQKGTERAVHSALDLSDYDAIRPSNTAIRAVTP
ncbi:FAD-dependent monooxygenase [Mesorhizobium shangrilense]|uniref:FAD-dependent monooxygenase n=1 Tax=Mesorhizobium shangrilense TaxID=460060 RepID=A0ABV2DND6_9HYPH